MKFKYAPRSLEYLVLIRACRALEDFPNTEIQYDGQIAWIKRAK